MSEDNEQKSIINWAKWQPWGDGKLNDYLHHSPNGGARNPREGAKFKQMGTLAGFPDLFLFIPQGGYHGLFIELKRPKTAKQKAGEVNTNQQAMINRLNAQGYKAVVCYGYDEAIQTIRDYLEIGE